MSFHCRAHYLRLGGDTIDVSFSTFGEDPTSEDLRLCSLQNMQVQWVDWRNKHRMPLWRGAHFCLANYLKMLTFFLFFELQLIRGRS